VGLNCDFHIGLFAFNQPGISLLEQEILKKVDQEPAKKRRRTEHRDIENNPDAWLQLARFGLGSFKMFLAFKPKIYTSDSIAMA